MKDNKRIKLLQIFVCLGCLFGMILSYELWFPISRTFPRVPFFISLSENVFPHIERVLSFVLVTSLLLKIFLRNLQQVLSFVAISSLCLLILIDQMRLQPWVYQYLLLLIVFAFHNWQTKNETIFEQTLGLVQIIIAGLYVWSGLQKLNFAFSHETLPILLSPLQNLFPTLEPPLLLLGLTLALIEVFIGCGLLWNKTRKICVGFAVILHTMILTLLIAKNYNSIVWIWNATLIGLVIIAFWQNEISVRKVFSKVNSWKSRFVKVIVLASISLPILSFFNLWDMYLSGALYSGSTEVGVIRINEDIFEKLPKTAKQVVFKTKTNKDKMLPLFDWAIKDLNVPVYPEKRVFKQITQKVCDLTENKNKVQLIIKERPKTLDGKYNVAQINCAELKGN